MADRGSVAIRDLDRRSPRCAAVVGTLVDGRDLQTVEYSIRDLGMRVVVRHRLVRPEPQQPADKKTVRAIVVQDEFLAPLPQPVAAQVEQIPKCFKQGVIIPAFKGKGSDFTSDRYTVYLCFYDLASALHTVEISFLLYRGTVQCWNI